MIRKSDSKNGKLLESCCGVDGESSHALYIGALKFFLSRCGAELQEAMRASFRDTTLPRRLDLCLRVHAAFSFLRNCSRLSWRGMGNFFNATDEDASSDWSSVEFTSKNFFFFLFLILRYSCN